MAMKRGPKPGKARGVVPVRSGPSGLGDCPPELVGLGRDLWLDAAAHLEATGRADRVYRTGLRIVCRLVETLEPEAGLNQVDTVRRWMHEMGLTVATAGRGATEARQHDEPNTGRARILSLIAGKTARA